MPSGLFLAESVGLEIEVEEIPRERFSSEVNLMGRNIQLVFQITHDASCEKNAVCLGGYPVEGKIPSKIRNGLSSRTLGFELVSNAFNTNEKYLPALQYICKNLYEMGESPKSWRGSIHVHVNTPYNLRVLKGILNLAQHLESSFFLLGGMGYENRGIKNNYCYMRPITGKGPQCVKTSNGRFTQVFSVKDLLEAKSVEDFFSKYGDVYNQSGKYIPVRYSWLNLVNLTGQGSLEFRIFNKTLNPYYLKAIIELCKKFVDFSYLIAIKPGMFPLNINSAFDIPKERSLEIFSEWATFAEIDRDILIILMEMMNSSSYQINDEYIFSHLMFLDRGDITSTHFRNNYNPGIISSSLIKRPEFVDVHNFRGENTDSFISDSNFPEPENPPEAPRLRRSTLTFTPTFTSEELEAMRQRDDVIRERMRNSSWMSSTGTFPTNPDENSDAQ